MSHLLAQWLNQTTHPSVPIHAGDLDKKFASGYQVCELLRTFQLLPEASAAQIADADHADAVVRNWTVVERVLREKLGVVIGSNEACKLVKAQPGAAAKLLYQIKSAVAAQGHGIPTLPTLPTQHGAANLDRPRLPSYPASPRVSSPVFADIVEAPSKHAFQEHEHEAFARLLRDKLARKPGHGKTALQGAIKPVLRGRDEIPLQDRLRARNSPEPKSQGASAAEPDEALEVPAVVRSYAAPTTRHRPIARHEKHQKPYPIEALQAEIAGFEKRLAEFSKDLPANKAVPPPPPVIAPHPLSTKRSSIATPPQQRRTSTATPQHHDADHDQHRQESRPPTTEKVEEEESDGPALDAEAIKRFVMLQAAMDPPHHLKMLARALPPIEDMNLQKREYLEHIRLRRLEDEGAKLERDQRRRKRALEDRRLQEERETAQLEEVALSKLLRQSKQERRIAENLLQVRHERQVMRENRLFLEKQYTQRRQKDYEEALAREYDLCERAREEYRRATALQLAQHHEILEDKKREKHRKRERDCRDIVLDVLQLSMKISDFRTLNDGNDVPKKFLEEWKLLFGHNKPLDKQYNPDLEKDAVESTPYDTSEPSGPTTGSAAAAAGPDAIAGTAAQAPTHAEKEIVAAGMKVLDDREFEDYLSGKGDWSYGMELPHKVLRNKALGKMVGTILDMTAPPEPVVETAKLPAVPLKIALIGKPFAGKRTIAKRLAAKYHLNVISVDELIQSTIRPTTDGVPSTPGEGKTGKPGLGAKVEISMLEGGSADDSLLVTLVVEAIQKLLPLEDAPPGEAGGFIITDFPRTRVQAQLFEKELSGYEDPKPVKPGNLKRTPKEKTRRKSQIAPADTQQQEPKIGNATSGLDAVIMLDVPNETAYDRASGRRVDPVTGKMYHLETNPPPVDDPGLMDRVTALNEDDGESGQVHYQVTAFEDQQEPMREWFSRFNNYHVVDGSTVFDRAYESTEIIVSHLIERKEREKENRNKDTADGMAGAEHTRDEEPAAGEADEARNGPNTVPDSETKQESSSRLGTSAGEEDKKSGKGGAPSGKVRLTTPVPTSAAPTASGKPPSTPTDKSGATAASAGASRSGPSAKERNIGSALEPKDMLKANKTGATPATPGTDRPMTEATERSDASPPTLTRLTTADGKRLPSKELADILADEWVTIESTYTDTLKFAFRSLRREKEAVLRYFYSTKVNFRRFLERPDRKQQLVELFQTEFNNVEDDLRSDPDAKAELHQRAEDLRDKLWDMSDKRKDEAEAERVLIVEDKWVEEHFVIIANVYIAMVQAEVDRYLGTKLLAADYFRDAYGTLLTDPPVAKTGLKIPLIATTAPAAMDLSALVLNGGSTESSHKLHRREAAYSADTRAATGAAVGGGAAARPAGGKSGTANTGKDSLQAAAALGSASTAAAQGAAKKGAAAPTPVGRIASNVEMNKHSGGGPTLPGPSDREQLLQDDITVYTDVLNACDMALGLLGQHEDGAGLADKDKKDKKRSTTAELSESRVTENRVADSEMDMMPEYQQIVDREDQLLRRKLERLKQHAIENLRSLRSKGIEVFTLLDDWVSARFGCEMDAVREMLNVIKEAIEVEAKLPNHLTLHGEKFKVDFGLLTYEPDPEPRPPSPVEKQMPDQFTVLQLGTLAQQFLDISHSGMLSWKEFIDCFQRLAAVSVGTEQLPDQYAALDVAQLQQICGTLDPYETGFVSWRKFLLLCARILPVPSLDYLLDLKGAYKSSPSFPALSTYVASQNPGAPAGPWKVSRADYMSVTLWFEDDSDAAGNGGVTDAFDAKFDRPGRLKEALYGFYETLPDSASRLSTAAKSKARTGAEDESLRSVDAAPSRLTTAGNAAARADEARSFDSDDAQRARPTDEHSRHGSSNVLDRAEPFPADDGDAAHRAGTPTGPATPPSAVSGDGTPSGTSMPQSSSFDAYAFLMSCCMDPSPKIGLQKAFAVVSDSDDGACTLAQIHQIFHFGLNIVEETHRLPPSQSVEDPFPMEMLARLFDDLPAASPDHGPVTMTFEHFLAASEPYPQLHSCGLYQIDDPAIIAIRSRPSSAV